MADATGTPNVSAPSTYHRSTDKTLIYVAGIGGSYVLTYPKGKLFGRIPSNTNGACADVNGDVFLTTDSGVQEYAHGGTTPIATLTLSGPAQGCSVDAVTGNLAVTFSGNSGSAVAIFPGAQGSAAIYPINIELTYCGYDAAGNLFVDGLTGSQDFLLFELPKGSGTFTNISINEHITYLPGQVQWDGQYLTVQALIPTRHIKSGPILYRLNVSGSTATVVSAIHFKEAAGRAAQSWIGGSLIVMPYAARNGGAGLPNVGVWQYPKGGKPKEQFKNVTSKHDNDLTGVALSGDGD